jgi:hypothetical protein
MTGLGEVVLVRECSFGRVHVDHGHGFSLLGRLTMGEHSAIRF